MFKCIARVIVTVILFTSLSRPLLVQAEDIEIVMNNGDLSIEKETCIQEGVPTQFYQPEDTIHITNMITEENEDQTPVMEGKETLAIKGVTVANDITVNIIVDNFLKYLSIGDNSTVNLSTTSNYMEVYHWNFPAITLGEYAILNIIGSDVLAKSIYEGEGKKDVAVKGATGSSVNLIEKDGKESSLTTTCYLDSNIVPTSGNAVSVPNINGISETIDYGVEEAITKDVNAAYIRETYSSIATPDDSTTSEENQNQKSESFIASDIPINNTSEVLNDVELGIWSENYKDEVLTSWSEVDSVLEDIEISDLTDEAICGENEACLLRMNIQNSNGIVPDKIMNKINETPERAVHFHLGEGVALTACTDSMNNDSTNIDFSKIVEHRKEGNINCRKVKFHEKRNLDGTLQFHTYLPEAHRGQMVSVYQVDESGERTLITTTPVGDNSSVCMEINQLQDYEFEYMDEVAEIAV